jgi:ribose transport system substrate-binding protein
MSPHPRNRIRLVTGGALAALLFLAGCTSNTPKSESGSSDSNAVSANDDPGKKVTIGFSGPAADHGWLAAINSSALAEAKKYKDVTLKTAEGTNDANLQISQIETFINDKVDAIVLLPTDGAALTDVATKAMKAGIPVVNVDREFSSPFAARTTILGDNYGMGVSAGTYACDLVKKKNLKDPVIAEIAGIDSLPLTQDRSKGFKDALKACGQNVDNRVAAEFTVESGEKAASNLLQAAPKIDIIWNHDTTRGSASRRPSTTPSATSSRSSAAPARRTRCGGSRRARWRPRSSTRRRRRPTGSGWPASSRRTRASPTSSSARCPSGWC